MQEMIVPLTEPELLLELAFIADWGRSDRGGQQQLPKAPRRCG